jgi:hypothetical protein
MGLHRTTWDQWAKLEKLKPDWVQLERDCEVVTVITPSFKVPEAVRVSNQNNDSALDDQSKAYVDLLLPRPLDPATDTGSRIKGASRDIVNESTYAPFDLFGHDRREFRATPFRPKQSTMEQTRPPLDLDAPRFIQVEQKLPLHHVYTDSSILTASKNIDEECHKWINEISNPSKKKRASAISCFITGKCERCRISVPAVRTAENMEVPVAVPSPIRTWLNLRRGSIITRLSVTSVA